MKILHLASGDLWAGAEVQLFHLATRLAIQEDVQLLVVLLNPGQLEQALKAKGIDVVVLDESKLSGLAIYRKLARLLDEYHPDILHTHRTKENVIGGFAAKLRGIKSVRTVHGATEFDGGIFNPRRMIFNTLDRLSAYLAQQKIIAVSDELAVKLRAFFPEQKLTVIENSIDEEYVDACAREMVGKPLDKNVFNVAFVGRFVPVKRVDLFYAIARRVIGSHPDGSIIFHMLGEGPLFDETRARLQADSLDGRLVLHGFVANPAPLIKQMDLLMFTSDHEGLPMTLLEAMTLGVPVLSRNLPTIRQVLCNGECGYVVNGEDVDEFAEVIGNIIANNTEARARAQRARQRIRDHYGIEANVQKYMTLYNSLLI